MHNPDAPQDPIDRFISGAGFNPRDWTAHMNANGHSGFLGMRYCDHGDTWIELAFDWREDLVGDPETGVLASGPIISLLDNATSMSVWTRTGKFTPQVTLDFAHRLYPCRHPGQTADRARRMLSVAAIDGLCAGHCP